MTSTLSRTSSAASSGGDRISLCISILDDDILALDVPKLAQSLGGILRRGRSASRTASQARYPIRGTFFGCCASSMATQSETSARAFSYWSADLSESTCESDLFILSHSVASKFFTVRVSNSHRPRHSDFSLDHFIRPLETRCSELSDRSVLPL